jgi:tyrosyl-tRNA synthetase
MLAREVAKDLNKPKPVAIHHHMLMGLKAPPDSNLAGVDRVIELKMSKSDPDSAIFMLDSPEDVRRKITKAYCPPKDVMENPVLEYCKYIIFELINSFKIERPEKYGGNVEYQSYEDMERDFAKGELNPPDLKPAVIKYLNQLLDPIREHFEKDKNAKKLYLFVKEADEKDKSK